jgi:hypothetical protein
MQCRAIRVGGLGRSDFSDGGFVRGDR